MKHGDLEDDTFKGDTTFAQKIQQGSFIPSEQIKQSHLPVSLIEDLQTKASRSLKRIRSHNLEKHKYKSEDFSLKLKNFLAPIKELEREYKSHSKTDRYMDNSPLPDRAISVTPVRNINQTQKICLKNTSEIVFSYVKKKDKKEIKDKIDENDLLFYQRLKDAVYRRSKSKLPIAEREKYLIRIEGKSKRLSSVLKS